MNFLESSLDKESRKSYKESPLRPIIRLGLATEIVIVRKFSLRLISIFETPDSKNLLLTKLRIKISSSKNEA